MKPVDFMITEYNMRQNYISQDHMNELWFLVPLAVLLCATGEGAVAGIVILIVWFLFSRENTKQRNTAAIKCLYRDNKEATEAVMRMRRIEKLPEGKILMLDATEEILVARNDYKRFLVSHDLTEREYKILMAPFEDEARAIQEWCAKNPDARVSTTTEFEMTALFKYRIDPFIVGTPTQVRSYCKELSAAFDKDADHVDYEKLFRITSWNDRKMPMYREQLMYEH